jgi:RNA polymerase sigma-70 factor, ECF subfamily
MQHEGHMARDEEFARWYHAHHDRIRALCARILRDPIAAEDMAQETLLRAWVRRDQMREEDLGAWLSVVARNLCLSSIRKDGRLVITDELPEKADHGADPAIEVGRRESRRNVRSALGKLGDRNRRVIDLREVREANYEEIGSELGVSAEGARAIAFRARRVLREHLAAVGEGFSGVLVGIRIRVRTLRARAREAAGSVEGAAGPSLQAGLNFALAFGVVVAGVAGSAAVFDSAALRQGPLAVTVSPGAGTPGRRIAARPEGINVAEQGSNRGDGGAIPGIPKPALKGSPYHPSDGSSDLYLRYGKAWVYLPSDRGSSSDGLEPAYWALNTGLETACEFQPSICGRLEYGFGGNGS